MGPFWVNIMSAAIPSFVVAIAVWYIQRMIAARDKRDHEERKKRQEEIDRREDKRIEYEKMILETSMASMSLSEATAKAVQRIPDAHCNGDMDAALDYALAAKNRQRDFFRNTYIEEH